MENKENAEIESLLRVEDDTGPDPGSHLQKVLQRVRANVGQRDSMLFAFVKFWTVIAEMVAPVFAQLARRRAEVTHSSTKPTDPHLTQGEDAQEGN